MKHEGPVRGNRAFVFGASGLKDYLLLCGGVRLGGRVPVNDVPPRFDVITAHILIFQIVGVLPDIETEHGFASEHEGCVLIRCRIDSELAILDDEPSPPRTEAAQAGGGEFFLKAGEGAKSGLNGIGEIARRLATTALFHLGPEERMIPMAAGIVADGTSDILRNGV